MDYAAGELFFSIPIPFSDDDIELAGRFGIAAGELSLACIRSWQGSVLTALSSLHQLSAAHFSFDDSSSQE